MTATIDAEGKLTVSADTPLEASTSSMRRSTAGLLSA